MVNELVLLTNLKKEARSTVIFLKDGVFLLKFSELFTLENEPRSRRKYALLKDDQIRLKNRAVENSGTSALVLRKNSVMREKQCAKHWRQ